MIEKRLSIVERKAQIVDIHTRKFVGRAQPAQRQRRFAARAEQHVKVVGRVAQQARHDRENGFRAQTVDVVEHQENTAAVCGDAIEQH
ncbi:hypothetical protein [Paraburkholderia sp. MM5496-R1]|uniref:hypothetical protein n=1 Tax=Paraburkholderia sp. MM5496-R1 TaxID=2991065 RepID=UPI003D23F91C